MLIQERTIAGLKAARARGRTGGRRRGSDDKIAQAYAARTKRPELSVREIAAAVGLSAGYLSRIFNGHRPKQ